jgi:hypothetical protein
MGLADRDYMRKPKVRGRDSRGESRLDGPDEPAVKPAKAWLPRAALALGAAGMLGAGVWWNGASNVSELDSAASAEVAPLDKVASLGDTTACRIKGNISGNGKKVYHVPGSRFYAQTEIETAVGERWFCSEEEAVAAGWRAPK